MGAGRIGVLLGNSRLRCGRFDGFVVSDTAALEYESVESLASERGSHELFTDETAELFVGSVRDDRLSVLNALFDDNRVEAALVAGRDFDIPIENHYDDPGEAGVDRLLNALAARTRWPGEAVIVVDFGTALSFSVVSAAGEFLGGPIAAGMRTTLLGLASATPRLPELEEGPEVPLIARSTAQALRAGILAQARSGVSGLVRGIMAELGGSARVVATGGEAQTIASCLDVFDSIEPVLTLEGLAVAAETGARR